MKWNLFFERLAHSIFPPRCAGCGTYAETPDGVCSACRATIPILNFAYCPTCKQRLVTPLPHSHTTYTLVAVTRFHNPRVQNIIHRLKYKRERRLARFCGELLAKSALNYFELFPSEKDSVVVLPVPLHPKRLRERGFNQSAEIAIHFLEYLHHPFPMDVSTLVRTKDTPSQTRQKSREARIENLRGCFSVTDSKLIQGKTTFIIDDVSTTGATLQEITTALRSAGARKVVTFVFAKTD